MSKISVKVKVIEKSDAREVNSRKSRRTHRIANAVAGDETGVVTLPLWDSNIPELKVGGTYRLESVYTKTYRGQLQLNLGRHSRIIETDEIGKVNRQVDMSGRNGGRRDRTFRDDIDYRRYREYAPGIGRIGRLDN
jgi:ssDNA-binding replication factor A large subunit